MNNRSFQPPTSNPLREPPTPHLRPLLAYFLLTILMTWPTILHLTDGIPGDGFDGWQNYWNLWWVKKALLELGTTPFFTDYLYPPQGASLLFHTLNIFNSLWTLPIQLNFGPAIAYNSVVLASFTLAGYGGYLLSLYTLTRLGLPRTQGVRAAAFAGGLVFTMSPFHFAHLLGHMQVFSLIWPPFYVLWLLRTLTPPPAPPLKGGGRTGKAGRDVTLTCLFLILTALVDWYQTLYLLIFTGLALLWTLFGQGSIPLQGRRRAGAGEHPSSGTPKGGSRGAGEQRGKSGFYASRFTLHASRFTPLLRPILLVLAIGFGFAVILSPVLIPMIRAARSTPEIQTGFEQSITLSADLLAFVLPSEMHPLWGEWAKTIAGNFSTTLSERLIFAGFVPLALGAYAVGRGRSKAWVRFWTLVVAVFFLLALGPYLHLNGQIVSWGNWPIPMPYWLLYYTIPFIRLTRSLSRYDLMVMLSLGVLVAIGLAYLSQAISDRRSATKTTHFPFTVHCSLRFATIHYSLPLLICFEFLAIPYPISKIDTPQFYFDLAAQPGDFTIAELPMNWDRPTPMLYQTVHGKRLLTAYTSRDNPLELAWRTPVFQHWRYLGPDIIDQPLAVIAPTIFYDFNLRYIVLDYWQMPPGPEREATEYWVAQALPQARPIYDDGRLKVYPAPHQGETQPYLSLGEGWSKRQENAAGMVTRSIFEANAERPAELFLHHPQNQALVLEITAAVAQGSTQEVTLLAAGEVVSKIKVTSTYSSYSITLPAFSSPLVKLSLVVEKPAHPVMVRRLSLN